MYQDKNLNNDSNFEDEYDEFDSEDEINNEFMLESAIDVGTHFLDVEPEEELLFSQHQEGHLYTKFKIKNPIDHCPVAYFIFTSAPIPVQIQPNMGFITAEEKEKTITISWHASQNPSKDRLENAMFFIKALPLKPDTNV